MKKGERQQLIKNIVISEDIATQNDLQNALQKQGVNATQATISRDIKELNLVKTSSQNGEVKYTILNYDNSAEDSRLKNKITSIVEEVTRVEFMNIVKTLPGNAHVLGAVVDDIESLPIVGTVAGNDTILLLSKNQEDAIQINQMFEENIIKEG